VSLHTTSATGVFSLLWLVVALPLLGAAILLVGARRTNRWGHLLGSLLPVVSFVLALVMFFALLGKDSSARSIDQHLYTWIAVGRFHVDVGLLVDPLSISFVLLITGVGSLIHIYSVGYMAHDPDRRRFFGYLNLFVASMLLLVLADSYLTLYVGWEGVGLASYLLIGFWNQRRDYATASTKAFVMNRVGDVGLSIAIMLMFATFGTVSIGGVAAGAPHAQVGVVTAIGLLLLLGACGKSAQIPLQAWLGDAMAGPTPVSALIHAATMVTAGVYLIARSNALFNLAPNAQLVVAIVGVATLLFGAIIACAKDDIKKGLAGSTMSQIGYMIMAAGFGPIGYTFAIAHLLTHGFFKADLFLGAGSVMHGMNDEVNMRRYGGLAKVMPITFVTFGFGYLAIIGIWPFSGFYTKDKIIEAAFARGGTQGWIFGTLALIGAVITAYYMTRMMAMTFFGRKRWAHDAHPHESGPIMTGPLLVLAALSLVAGAFLILGSRFAHWVAPVLGTIPEGQSPISTVTLTVVTLVLVIVAAVAAYWRYAMQPVADTTPVLVSPLVAAARRDLYQDAINETLFMRPGQYLTRFLVFFDNRVVDGAVNGLAALIGGISGRTRRLQTGFARSYALSMLAGAAVIALAVVLVRF